MSSRDDDVDDVVNSRVRNDTSADFPFYTFEIIFVSNRHGLRSGVGKKNVPTGFPGLLYVLLTIGFVTVLNLKGLSCQCDMLQNVKRVLFSGHRDGTTFGVCYTLYSNQNYYQA